MVQGETRKRNKGRKRGRQRRRKEGGGRAGDGESRRWFMEKMNE